MQEKHRLRLHREDGHRQAVGSGCERNHTCWHLDLGLLASRAVRKPASAAEAPQPVAAQRADAWPSPRPPGLDVQFLHFFLEPTCCPWWRFAPRAECCLRASMENSRSDRNTRQRAQTSNPEVATPRRHVAIQGSVPQAPFPCPSVDLTEGASASPLRVPSGKGASCRRILFSFYLLTHAHSQPVPSRQKLPCVSVKPALRH